MSNKKNKKRAKQSATYDKKNLKKVILSMMYEDQARSFNYKQISSNLGIKDADSRQLVTICLEELHENG